MDFKADTVHSYLRRVFSKVSCPFKRFILPRLDFYTEFKNITHRFIHGAPGNHHQTLFFLPKQLEGIFTIFCLQNVTVLPDTYKKFTILAFFGIFENNMSIFVLWHSEHLCGAPWMNMPLISLNSTYSANNLMGSHLYRARKTQFDSISGWSV